MTRPRKRRPEPPADGGGHWRGEATLVDIVRQPLHEARAPVSEWIA